MNVIASLTRAHSRGAKAPEWCMNFRAESKRAQGMPGAWCARSLACKNWKAHEHSHHGHTGSPGIPYAMVLTVSSVISPVTGLFATVLGGITPASWRQHRGVRTTRLRRPQKRRSSKAPPRPPHPDHNVRDDRETPLCLGRDEANCEVICLKEEPDYF